MSAGDYAGTYDPTKVIVTIGGVIVSGFGDGDAITARYDEDRYTKYTGADGEVSRSKNASRAGSIEVVLAQTSKANDELSALFNLALFGGADGVFPVGLVDLSGRTVLAASKCWIKTAPDVVFGKEVTDRTWTFDTADLSFQVGGNG